MEYIKSKRWKILVRIVCCFLLTVARIVCGFVLIVCFLLQIYVGYVAFGLGYGVYNYNQTLNTYDRSWIKGKTEAQIVERYGDFDLKYHDSYGVYGSVGAWYLYGEDGHFIGTGDSEVKCYAVYFDESGCAVRVGLDSMVPFGG